MYHLKKSMSFIIGAIVVLISVACILFTFPMFHETVLAENNAAEMIVMHSFAIEAVSVRGEWLDTPLTDVTTREIVTLRGLTENDSSVVLHIFAAWCPVSNAQLAESTTFLQTYSGKAHLISMDIDPSENAEMLAEHIATKGYDGLFVTAERPIVQGLADLFGEEIIMSIPQTVIISDDDFFYLGPGVVRSDSISSTIDQIRLQHVTPLEPLELMKDIFSPLLGR